MITESKHKKMLEDNELKRWYENLEAGSKITADVNLRNLGRFCELSNMTPEMIIELAKNNPRELKDRFIDFVRSLESQGKAGSYIGRIEKALRSWLKFNDIDIKMNIKVKGSNENPTIANERVPNKEELSKILRKASLRGRVAIALIAFSGLRPESLGNYGGTDGIRLGDLKELNIETLEFEKVPTMIVVRSSLSKAKHQYFTFIPEEGVTYILDYLQDRKKRGENLTSDSPLLNLDEKGVKKHNFLRTQLITRNIRETIRSAGLKMRPYVLRSYFATALDIAESKGLISHPWRQFFMGHKGDIEARYSTNKRLSPDLIEEMREAYKKCTKFLETRNTELSESNAKLYLQQQLLLAVGYKQEEIDKIDLSNMSNEDFQKLLRDKVTRALVNNGSKQKVVKIDELAEYISKGYEFVAALPNGTAIVKLPF